MKTLKDWNKWARKIYTSPVRMAERLAGYSNEWARLRKARDSFETAANPMGRFGLRKEETAPVAEYLVGEIARLEYKLSPTATEIATTMRRDGLTYAEAADPFIYRSANLREIQRLAS